ncbi:hypothetical protein VTK73DRAFT_3126 [Phialemonium thermophilum]|uniref:FAD-binding domain-containing protein n=1 Tax=Phialemonium thermophilum TaxID=223376 RepID=A0ABR3VKJ0_9PEZI
MPNVTLFFNHKLTGADFRRCKAWFELQGRESSTGRAREIEVDFDFMIGADGAHSAVRYHMMKFTRMDYRQEYIDTLWCEFQIAPRDDDDDVARADRWARFRISPCHLHIWPGKDFMFIAIPSKDGSFTCTLFAPSSVFERLEVHPETLPAFFDHHFPGVTDLISPQDLISSFYRNPHLPLISIKCKPYHYGSSVVIVGDAAHAMVPFYGQGMNAGLEDVRVLFDILDKHARMDDAKNNPGSSSSSSVDDHDGGVDGEARASVHVLRSAQRAAALAEYTAIRIPDAHAINDLALQNYVEMRASVLSPTYRLRKRLEELLSVYAPGLGWQTKYARVSFGNERYSEVVARSDHQGRVLVGGFIAAVGVPLVAGVALLWFRHGRTLGAGVRSVVGSVLGWVRTWIGSISR